MDFPCARFAHNPRHVLLRHATAGHNDNVRAALVHEFFQKGYALLCGSRRARCEHAAHAGCHEEVECAARVAAEVEGAVESKGQAVGSIEAAAEKLRVDAAVGQERTRHNAICAEAHGGADIGEHNALLVFII